MLSINMRIFKTTLILIILFYSDVRSHPVAEKESHKNKEDSSSNSLTDSPIHSSSPIHELQNSPVNPSTSKPESPLTSLENLENSESSSSTVQGDHYDQRQNGSENYRIHVDGFVLVFAPLEPLLSAGSHDLNYEALASLAAQNNALVAPKQDIGKPMKPNISSKNAHRGGMRLATLLAPFLRSVHHD